jgi:hypothetical protein
LAVLVGNFIQLGLGGRSNLHPAVVYG